MVRSFFRNQYYGGQWATFSFEEFIDWAARYNEVTDSRENKINKKINKIKDLGNQIS